MSQRGRRGPPRAGSAAGRRATAFERALTRSRSPAEEPPWLTTALDAIARHRATGEPMGSALKHAQRRGRPGSLERRRSGDAAFGWARFRGAAEPLVEEHLRAFGGVAPPRRVLDAAAVALALRWSGVDSDLALPAPLAALVEDPPSPSLRPSLPAWLEAKVAALPDAEPLFAAMMSRAPVGLAVDPRLADRAEVVAALVERGTNATPSALSPWGIRASGRVALDKLPPKLRRATWPMDEGSQRVALAIEAVAGERVLDLCAGGGGKARFLAATGCDLVCADVDLARLTAAKDRVGDAASYVIADGRSPPFADASFDAVLVDAPCTGTGTLRRAPDQASRLREIDLEELCATQRALVVAAGRLVVPGGRVVYATCSLLPDENERVVEDVERSGGLVLDGPASTLRPDRDGTDGFFIARFRRPASTAPSPR